MSFEGRYLRQVGTLYRQLDEWEERIAELHVKHYPAPPPLDASPVQAAGDIPSSRSQAVAAPLPNLKAIFHELARRIHPDFAIDVTDAERRTRLMAEANAAYLREDIIVLERMLHGFDEPSDFARERLAEAELAAIRRSIQLVRHDIATAEADTAALLVSDSAQLRERTIGAALAGRDLLAEMAARVKGSIGMAMRRYEVDLHRIQHPPANAAAGTIDPNSLLSAAIPTARRFMKKQKGTTI